jgi:hypothetical protein
MPAEAPEERDRVPSSWRRHAVPREARDGSVTDYAHWADAGGWARHECDPRQSDGEHGVSRWVRPSLLAVESDCNVRATGNDDPNGDDRKRQQ